MAKVHIYPDCNKIIAHMPEVKAHIGSVGARVAARARDLLNERSEVRTGASYISFKQKSTDAWITLVDRNMQGKPAAVMISIQHNILWDALMGG